MIPCREENLIIFKICSMLLPLPLSHITSSDSWLREARRVATSSSLMSSTVVIGRRLLMRLKCRFNYSTIYCRLYFCRVPLHQTIIPIISDRYNMRCSAPVNSRVTIILLVTYFHFTHHNWLLWLFLAATLQPVTVNVSNDNDWNGNDFPNWSGGCWIEHEIGCEKCRCHCSLELETKVMRRFA